MEGKMLGETILVFLHEETDKDDMGEPVYTWRSYEVENVLVRPLAGSDVIDTLRPDGVQVSYSLAFPKTASELTPRLKGARVSLVDRGMSTDIEEALFVSGAPDITRPCPTQWNAIVEVGRLDG